MAEFLTLTSPGEALDRFLESFTSPLGPEVIDASLARGRVTSGAVLAGHPLPPFTRSTVDGYAVRAEDTFGASDSLPVYLRLIGEVEMGREPEFSLMPASCALIHTGGMLPKSADAVVMVENTQEVREKEIEVLRAVGIGENLIRAGEDANTGEVVIPPGTRLRAVEVGALMALGITHLPVIRRPIVGIISTGDEIVPPDGIMRSGTMRDVNSYSLSALVEQCGAIPRRFGIVKDSREELFTTSKKALAECDFVIITAGSSASARDLTAQVIADLGKPGVLVHGVSVRPGKPTILAACRLPDSQVIKPVVGLPGNPVSALVIAILFLQPVIEKLSGVQNKRVRPEVRAYLSVNLASQAGREDWIPVRLVESEGKRYADPVFGKSNLILSLSRADGLARIKSEVTGLNAGDEVEVMLME